MRPYVARCSSNCDRVARLGLTNQDRRLRYLIGMDDLRRRGGAASATAWGSMPSVEARARVNKLAQCLKLIVVEAAQHGGLDSHGLRQVTVEHPLGLRR